MIVAFSTSSPQASVALLQSDGTVLASAEEQAPKAASGACMRMLESLLAQTGRDLQAATLFLADLGPGSFTGVKVAVTLAKTFAYVHGVKAGGATSFDLISADGRVVMPSKRGEFFVREPGADPVRQPDLPEAPFTGFGPGVEPAVYPHAARFATLLSSIAEVDPERLVPNYVIEPAISVPKKPYGVAHGA